MSDFDGAMKKITEVLYTAARKSGEILENTKISYTVSGEKEKISKIQSRIGAKFYQLYQTPGFSPEKVSISDFLADFEEIAAIEKNIAEMEKSTVENKAFTTCAECSAKLDAASVYCPKCGAKLPVEPSPEPESTQEEPPKDEA